MGQYFQITHTSKITVYKIDMLSYLKELEQPQGGTMSTYG